MPKHPQPPNSMFRDARMYILADKGNSNKRIVSDNLSGLRLYLTTTEEFIEREEAREIESLEKHAGASSPDFWAWHYPVQWQEIIGSQLRKSFVVSLVSLAEFHIGMLCRDVVTITEAQITIDDLKGNIFSRARKFLETFARFTSPAQVDWELMGDIYALRNNIVHNAALVEADRNSSRLESLMQKAPGISNPSAGILDIKKEFCLYVLSHVETFMNDMHNEYAELCNRVESFVVKPAKVT